MGPSIYDKLSVIFPYASALWDGWVFLFFLYGPSLGFVGNLSMERFSFFEHMLGVLHFSFSEISQLL